MLGRTSSVLLLLLFVDCLWAATFITRFSCNPTNPNPVLCAGYYVYLPNSYNAASTTVHPTILTLHGLGENGNGTFPDIDKLLRHGMPKYISQNQWNTAWDFIVVAPQHSTGKWNLDSVSNIVKIMNRDYPKIDQNRIYLTGYSAGGGGVWAYASGATQSKLIAAIAPICGTGSVTAPPVAGVNSMVQANLPVWAFHNSNDPTVNVQITHAWIRDLNAAGINPMAQKTIYTSSSHDAWSLAYYPVNSPLYAWFLTHSLSGTATATPAPTPKPTPAPTPKPTSATTPKPTATPTPKPTSAPTPKPTSAPTPKPTTAPAGSCPAANIGTGIGLMGVYYTGLAFGSGMAARVDPTINFVWATGSSPVFPLPASEYSVRWTGTVRAKFTGEHTFFANSDDGVRVWVNNVQLINQWLDRPTLEVSGKITLTAGLSYPITVEKYNNLNGATAILSWETLPCLPKEVVPASQLTPGALATNACN